MKIYRRGLWQIINIILWSICCFVFIGGSIFIAIDLYYDFAIERVVVLAVLAVIAIPYFVFNYICLFRSYIMSTDSEIKVTANVNRNSRLMYKDQNGFTLQYSQIQGLYLTMHTPNYPVFARSVPPHFITLALQTDNNNRYITLHYHSKKQIILIIDRLLDQIEQKTGNRISDKCGQELLDEFYDQQRAKSKK